MTLQLDADRPADVLELSPDLPSDDLPSDDLDLEADLSDLDLDLDAHDVDETTAPAPRRIALVIGAGLLLALITALAATALIAGRSSALFDVVGGALIEQASTSPLDLG